MSNEKFEELFAQIDFDANGTIDKNEMAQFIKLCLTSNHPIVNQDEVKTRRDNCCFLRAHKAPKIRASDAVSHPVKVCAQLACGRIAHVTWNADPLAQVVQTQLLGVTRPVGLHYRLGCLVHALQQRVGHVPQACVHIWHDGVIWFRIRVSQG